MVPHRARAARGLHQGALLGLFLSYSLTRANRLRTYFTTVLAFDEPIQVKMVPPSGRARLEAFIRGRSEWCLSRQRPWGVPIPAFYNTETGEALLTTGEQSYDV